VIVVQTERGSACESASDVADRRRGRLKPSHVQGIEEAMIAIAVILLFVIAVGALNAFEFGRID